MNIEETNLTQRRISEHLLKGRRFDGRKPLELRKLEITTGVSKNAEGSARVKLGNTEVVAGIKLNVATPYPNEEESGTMMTTVELTPLSSSRYELGPPRFDAIEVARIIDRGLRESGMIDFKKLCITPGEKVWSIFVDIFSINDDGNVMDAAGIAALAALRSAKMPKYDKETGKVLFGEWTEDKLPLNEEITPINLTFHKIGDNFLIDPTAAEEDSAESRISLALSNWEGQVMVNSVQKSNEAELSILKAEEVIDLAEKTFKELSERINTDIRK